MDLVLWRHADAEPDGPDLQRRLTAKGEAQARRMALWLHAHLPADAQLLASPAVRAQQTAQVLAELTRLRLRTVEQIAPGASADDILAAVGWPDGHATVIVVGHQPTLGAVASRLLVGHAHDVSIRKAGVWWFSHRERHHGETVVRAVMNPDFI